MMKTSWVVGMVLIVLVGFVSADTDWNVESGNWADDANWTDGKPDASDGYINIRYSDTSVCTLNTAEGPFTCRFIMQNGQTLNIEDGGSVGTGWARVGRSTPAYVNLSGNGSFLMNDNDLYIGLENGYCEWTMSDTSSLIVNADADDGEELYIGEDGGMGVLRLIGSGVTVNVDRIRFTANSPGGSATMEFVMDAGGASTIVVQRTFIGEAGDAHLLLSATEDLPQEDLVLIEATSGYGIDGKGVFDTLNGGPAVEGTEIVLGGNLYALSYAYDANGDSENNDVALVFLRSAKNMARSPVPADGSSVSNSPLTLSWVLPDPNDGVSPVSCDVYFGMDPNRPQMDKVSLPAGVSSVEINATNFPVYGVQPLPDANDFYWVVDCHDPSADPNAGMGLFWTFHTDYNLAPVVDAGPDTVTWLGRSGTPGQELVYLSGAVSDDGKPGPYAVLWTQVSGPEVVAISPDNTESSSVVITAAGVYEFMLTADDGEKQAGDTVQVVVGTDSCHASYLNGSAYDAMDFNEDCSVDLEDFAEFAAAWLNCTNTLEPCR